MIRTLLTTFLILALHAGCTDVDGTDHDPTFDLGGVATDISDELQGQSGTEIPDHCADVGHVAVTDTSQAPDGFDFSVDDLMAETSGEWTGNIVIDQQDESIAINLQLAGEIIAVTTQWVITGYSADDGTGDDSMENDEESCLPYYQFPMTMTLSSGSLLQETIPVMATSDIVDAMEFYGNIDPSDVQGSTSPSFDPTQFDEASFGVTGNVFASSTRGYVMWRGSNEAPEPVEQTPCEISNGINGCIDPDTETCGACVGTTGPPGIVEIVGQYTTTR